MWLINTATLQLEEVLEPRKKRYAILSHTWEKDEVSFQEFADLQIAKKKAGFDKIIKTCQMASSRGLEYAWIDTCCIDKTSSAELSEAINSMFEWYKQSDVCFAFVADLLPVARGGALPDWLTHGQYRWFTRGWTLQELIAPKKLEFFDSTWRFRGDKVTLRAKLSQITGIDMSALVDSAYLSGIPVGRKMSWASTRKTTRIEDIAYCLLGIFDINMPLIYGEGVKAFFRLQEEIAKQYNDLSLFSWVANSERAPESQLFRGILAYSPSEFAHCGDIVAYDDYRGINPEFSLTNNGFRMEANLGLGATGGYVLALDGVTLSRQWLGIYLRKIGSGYVRQYPHKLYSTSDLSIWSGERTILYIRKSLGNKENGQILTELASRIYIRYLPIKPYYSIEDTISFPEALWISHGTYFLTMESALRLATPGRGFHPLFTGFKGFNIKYQGAHVCSCLLICGIFPNIQGDTRPLAVIYMDKDPSTKDVFEVVERRQHERGGTLLAEIRQLILSKHAPITGNGVLAWEHVRGRVTELIMGNHCIVISLTINMVTHQEDEALGGEDTYFHEPQLGPDIQYLPDKCPPDDKGYVVSVRVEGKSRNSEPTVKQRSVLA